MRRGTCRLRTASERASESKDEDSSGLTDIAPERGKIADVVVPYEPVDEDDRVADENPGDEEDGAGVAGAKMRGGGEGEEDKADD